MEKTDRVMTSWMVFNCAGGEFVRADAVGRHLEAILEEGDAPTDHYDFPQGDAAIFQMAVPGEGHEDVGNGEQENGAHCVGSSESSCQRVTLSYSGRRFGNQAK